MMSVPTLLTAIAPPGAGVPDAPPGVSGDPPTPFLDLLDLSATDATRQPVAPPGKALPVAQFFADPIASADPESTDPDRPMPDEDRDDTTRDSALLWCDAVGAPRFPHPTPPAQFPESAKVPTGFPIAIPIPPPGPVPVTPPHPSETIENSPPVPVETEASPASRIGTAPGTPVTPVRPEAAIETLAPEPATPPTPDFTDRPIDRATGPSHPVTPRPTADRVEITPPRGFDGAIEAAAARIVATLRTPGTAPVMPRPRDEGPATIDAFAASATATILAHGAAPVASADQPTLDMGRHGWPSAMVDHIESLRDAADAADTSIRIMPDALGTIDVSVRRDGDVTHVQFTAEQAATRTILADAQPRLAELAEARGLKLGQSNIDSGSDRQPHQQQPSAFVPHAPRRAALDETVSDHRIA